MSFYFSFIFFYYYFPLPSFLCGYISLPPGNKATRGINLSVAIILKLRKIHLLLSVLLSFFCLFLSLLPLPFLPLPLHFPFTNQELHEEQKSSDKIETDSNPSSVVYIFLSPLRLSYFVPILPFLFYPFWHFPVFNSFFSHVLHSHIPFLFFSFILFLSRSLLSPSFPLSLP